MLGAEDSRVGGGVAGEVCGLVVMGLIETGLIETRLVMSDGDGRINEDVIKDGAVVLVFSRNLPLSSHCMTLTGVANMRPSRGR